MLFETFLEVVETTLAISLLLFLLGGSFFLFLGFGGNFSENISDLVYSITLLQRRPSPQLLKRQKEQKMIVGDEEVLLKKRIQMLIHEVLWKGSLRIILFIITMILFATSCS